MKHHLARTHKNVTACNKVTEDVQKTFKNILEVLQQRNSVNDDVVEFFEEEEYFTSKGGITDKFMRRGKGKQVALLSMVQDRSKPRMDISRMIYS